jgi:hypothetical protein
LTDLTDTAPVIVDYAEASLTELEVVITRGLATFVEVGAALLAVRDRTLYQLHGYDTFEAYCAGRWEIGRAHAYRLIAAAQIVASLSPMGDTPPPVLNERQARALAPLRDDPEAMAAILDEVGPEATAADIEAAVERFLFPVDDEDGRVDLADPGAGVAEAPPPTRGGGSGGQQFDMPGDRCPACSSPDCGTPPAGMVRSYVVHQSAAAHQWGRWITDPAAVVKGRCGRCNGECIVIEGASNLCTYCATKIAACSKGHAWSPPIIDVDGSWLRVCARCGETEPVEAPPVEVDDAEPAAGVLALGDDDPMDAPSPAGAADSDDVEMVRCTHPGCSFTGDPSDADPAWWRVGAGGRQLGAFCIDHLSTAIEDLDELLILHPVNR